MPCGQSPLPATDLSNLGCGKVRFSSMNTTSSGNMLHASPQLKACLYSPLQADMNSAEQKPTDVSCLSVTARTSRNADCLWRTLDAFPTCFLTHVMQWWHRLITTPHPAARRGWEQPEVPPWKSSPGSLAPQLPATIWF